ncbi:MAG: hypothetical protein HYZ50_15215 [Deltaproteobacteria bacterium]|nr:hypothetical protein [Deltaproteobacteria bacterium]
MKVIQTQERLLIEIEPEGHDSKITKSGKPGFFGRKDVLLNGRLYLVQVLGYVKNASVSGGESAPEHSK